MKAQQLISEAVFFELNMRQWRKGLWADLQPYTSELELIYRDNLKYYERFPNSPDAARRTKALARILDSVTESYRSMDILRGVK